jgi:osmotically-inducible protein OsmY
VLPEEAVMRSDAEVREDVVTELGWEPQITRPESIAVSVVDGAVTLAGRVPTYSEKLAAARAAERVQGVKAVANDLEVKLDGVRDDGEIATAIAHILEWNTNIPEDRVKARVQRGWVTLEGTVDYAYQRHEVERMVRHVRGVLGVTNSIEVEPPARGAEVQQRIEEMLRRNAELDARHIRVEVSDHTAHLYGHVHSVHEATTARAAAAASPGIASVASHLEVLP